MVDIPVLEELKAFTPGLLSFGGPGKGLQSNYIFNDGLVDAGIKEAAAPNRLYESADPS